MGFLEDMQKSIEREQRDMQRSIAKDFRMSISKEGRVRIPAKRKHEVEDKYHKKCARCKKKPVGVKLQFHHINMKNSDNSLKNLELLCPNCHIYRHSKAFRRIYRDSLGNKYHSKLVKKKPKIKKKRKKRRARNNLDWIMRI